MRHFFCDSLKRILMALSLTVVGIFSATAANLPTGYTELEYIESNGTQYIDTGIQANLDTKLEIDFALLSNNGNTNIAIYGAAGGNQNSSAFVLTTNSGRSYIFPQFDSVSRTTVANLNFVLGKKYHSVQSKDGWYYDGTLGATWSKPTAFTTPRSMILFGSRGGGESGADTLKSSAQVWTVKIWNGSTLVRDFVPAKNASGVIGMYDTVNDVFYTNAGTGTFTAGPIVCPNGGTLITYTSATGTVSQSGMPSPTAPVEPTFYTQGNMVLRKVGDYADSYDSATGKITRHVGVKVLDGTEEWVTSATPNIYVLNATDALRPSNPGRIAIPCTHFVGTSETNANMPDNSIKQSSFTSIPNNGGIAIKSSVANNLNDFKDWLADKYTAGTPVTVYYPLATATEEDWVAEQCENGNLIKIATTKYTEDAFAGLMTTLSEAITKVTNIVDTTVQQATEIGNLATTKQDRPDTDCPPGRKCLLIMGADNKPHWYLIQE